MDYLLIIIVSLMMIVLILIIIYLLNQNTLKQRLFIQEIILKNEKDKLEDLNNIKTGVSKDLDEVKNKIANDLIMFQHNMTNSLKGDFHQLNESTYNKLVNIETKVNESLNKGFESTSVAFSNILEQMARIDETQKNLNNLSNDINSLQGILQDKKTRGTFGEIELYSILENAFGNNAKYFEKQFKLSNGLIVDSIIHAPSPLGDIVIDSKFPLENYNRIYSDSLSKEEQNKARNEFKKDVVKHIKDINSKYIIKGETAEMAYMFIPAEAVFAEIYGHYDELIQLSYQLKVFLVSPTTLMAYITAIKGIYLGQERNAQVEEIQKEFVKLSLEFQRFEERFQVISKDFDKTYKDLQLVSITSNKIVNRFKQIEEVDLNIDDIKGVSINHE